MSLVKLIEDSAKKFGEQGHISLHPYLWHIAMLDREFVSRITTIPYPESKTGQIAELKGIKIFISADPTPGRVYQDRILKALVALQAPDLLEFV